MTILETPVYMAAPRHQIVIVSQVMGDWSGVGGGRKKEHAGFAFFPSYSQECVQKSSHLAFSEI